MHTARPGMHPCLHASCLPCPCPFQRVHLRFPWALAACCRDALFEGDCDAGIRELCRYRPLVAAMPAGMPCLLGSRGSQARLTCSPAARFLLPAACCQLPAASCLLPAASCLLLPGLDCACGGDPDLCSNLNSPTCMLSVEFRSENGDFLPCPPMPLLIDCWCRLLLSLLTSCRLLGWEGELDALIAAGPQPLSSEVGVAWRDVTWCGLVDGSVGGQLGGGQARADSTVGRLPMS